MRVANLACSPAAHIRRAPSAARPSLFWPKWRELFFALSQRAGWKHRASSGNQRSPSGGGGPPRVGPSFALVVVGHRWEPPPAWGPQEVVLRAGRTLLGQGPSFSWVLNWWDSARRAF